MTAKQKQELKTAAKFKAYLEGMWGHEADAQKWLSILTNSRLRQEIIRFVATLYGRESFNMGNIYLAITCHFDYVSRSLQLPREVVP